MFRTNQYSRRTCDCEMMEIVNSKCSHTDLSNGELIY